MWIYIGCWLESRQTSSLGLPTFNTSQEPRALPRILRGGKNGDAAARPHYTHRPSTFGYLKFVLAPLILSLLIPLNQLKRFLGFLQFCRLSDWFPPPFKYSRKRFISWSEYSSCERPITDEPFLTDKQRRISLNMKGLWKPKCIPTPIAKQI